MTLLQEFLLPWRFILETRRAASMKQQKDAEMSKPKERKCVQLEHLNKICRDKPENDASMVMFHLTGQLADSLIDTWVPRAVEGTDPLNGFLKSLGSVLLAPRRTEQVEVDQRVETLRQIQYNMVLLNYFDGVLIARGETFSNYVSSVARMVAGGFLDGGESETFRKCHTEIAEVLLNMQSTCRYYLELCPKAKTFFPKGEGSSFDPAFALSERTRLDTLFQSTLKHAEPIIIDRPKFTSVSVN